MLSGFRKGDPVANKKSPVEGDVPEYLAEMGRCDVASQFINSIGDNNFMAYNYLLRVGEYTVKRGKNKYTQTEQFKFGRLSIF